MQENNKLHRIVKRYELAIKLIATLNILLFIGNLMLVIYRKKHL